MVPATSVGQSSSLVTPGGWGGIGVSSLTAGVVPTKLIIDFTATSRGKLVAGNAITVTASQSIYAADGSTSVVLGSGSAVAYSDFFSYCGGTAVTAGNVLTVTLIDGGLGRRTMSLRDTHACAALATMCHTPVTHR